jgi:hypothetical protein
MPPALFDVTEDGDMRPPIFEPVAPGEYSPRLTPFGAHDGLGPGVFGGQCCDEALYGSIESSGRRVWIYHVCSRTGPHDEHKCDRCDHTWETR